MSNIGKKRIVVIGGSAAGPKAAAKARRLDQTAEITIIQKGPHLSMASCGYPYYVAGYFDNRDDLISTPVGIVMDPKFFLAAKGIVAKVKTEVTRIDPEKHVVECVELDTGKTEVLEYDKLIIATGSVPSIPPVPGTDLDGITTLQSMRDAEYLRKIRDEGKVKNAVIVGAGLIGIETCEALKVSGLNVTCVELLPQILPFLDWEMAKLVENYVRSQGVDVITENAVTEFLGSDGRLVGVKLADGTEIPCELAVIAIGVKPNSDLARRAGLEIGETGGIKVNEYMQTSDPDIYAVGDCTEIVNRITGTPTLAPYGDIANLEGRVAAENVVLGNSITFPGTTHTGICKVFEYAAGSTGVTEAKAQALGFDDIVTVITAGPHKPGFMGGKLLVSKMTADRKTGRILGLQCVGLGDVCKQISQGAMAIMGGLTVDDVANADLPYAPPFSLAIDHFIMTAHVLQNKMKGRMRGISSLEVKRKIDRGEDIFLLDVRTPGEYEEVRLGVGEKLIPLGAIRQRMDELPKDKNKEIICFCKISLRGYEAASLLEANGWTNVKVMEGGIAAYPFKLVKQGDAT